MSIDKSSMISAIQSNIDSASSSCDTCDLVALAAATNRVTTDRKSTIALGCDLPDLNLGTIPEGTIYYVQELGIPVVATQFSWQGLDGRIYRNDIPSRQVWGWGEGCAIGTNNILVYSSPVREITSSTNWCFVSAGGNLSSFINTSGEMYGTAGFQTSSVGDNTSICRSSPTQEITSSTNWCSIDSSAASYTRLALKTDGTMWGWGRNTNYGLPIPLGETSSPTQELCSATNWCLAVASTFTGGYALKTDNTLWSWSYNTNGQFGNGTTTNFPCPELPTEIAYCETNWCFIAGGDNGAHAIKNDGTFWSWGCQRCGKFGVNDTINYSSPVREITSSTNWHFVSGAACNVMILNTAGELYASGRGAYGANGDNTNIDRSSPVKEITSSTNWCRVAAAFITSHAIKTDGTLWGWGYNVGGRVGDGTTVWKSSPVQEVSSSTDWHSVSVGSAHVVGIRNVVQ